MGVFIVLIFLIILIGIPALAIIKVHNESNPKCKRCGRRTKKGLLRAGLCPQCWEKKKRKEAAEQKKRMEEKASKAVFGNPNEKIVSSVYKGQRLKYHYDDVRLFIVPGQEPPVRELDPGDDLQLVQEPDNTYDRHAVYLQTYSTSRAGKVKVGYLRKGKLQDMVNDFLREGSPILSHITSIDDDTGEIKVFLGFYRGSDFSSYEYGEYDEDEEDEDEEYD